MRTILKSAVVMAILFATNVLHAQGTGTASLIPSSPANLSSLPSYSDAQLEEMMSELAAMPLIWPTNLPDNGMGGTYWSLAHPNWPPLPSTFGTPVWNLTTPSVSPMSAASDASADSATSAGSSTVSDFYLLDDYDFPPIPQGGTNSGGGYLPQLSGGGTPVNTNLLWLQITNIADNTVFVNLNGATDYVYGIFSATNLMPAMSVSNWSIETEVFPGTNTNSAPFTVSMNGRNALFLSAMDWTGVTANGNQTPQWWFYYWFGSAGLDLSDTNLDSLGQNTLLEDYQSNMDPNVILFSLQFTNDYFYANPVGGAVSVQTGEPFYQAVLVNDPNFYDAVWQPFASTNLSINLGLTNGTYTVLVGLRGVPTNATATWQGTQLMLDTAPLVLALTNPIASVVSQPMIQVQGYASKPLASLTFDVSNAAGFFPNQTGYVTGQYYDTNLQMITTNYFQCYDVPLTNGLNVVTLHATDMGGNTASTNESFTLDYSNAVPPTLSILWPPDGTLVSGTNFTLQGQVNDDTVTVTAQITDENGDTNTVQGLVERDGTVWVSNLPLAAGTNFLTITATNAAGYSMTTNLTLAQSAVMVTMNPLGELNESSVSVTGTINDENYDVYVNGVEAYYLDTNGDWEADNVPANAVGTATFEVQVYSGDPDLEGSEDFSDDQPPMVVLSDYSYVDNFLWVQSSGYGVDETENTTYKWDHQSGGEYNYLQVGTAETEARKWAPVYYTYGYDIGPDTTNNWFAFNPTWENASWSTDDETRNVQSALMLTPSGKAIAGETILSLVEAQVTNELTGLQLPASAVQFMNQLAGTSSLDVTDYDGTVWTEALVSAPSGATPAVTPIGQNISFNYIQAKNVTLEIIDANTGNNLTGRTNTVIVGQQMNLMCRLNARNASSWNSMLTNIQWTVPGDAISNYVVASDSSSAMVVTNFPTTNSTATFYWVNGGSNLIVQCAATVNGMQIAGQATFNVVRPTINFTGSIGSVSLDTNYTYFPNILALHLGGTVNNGTTNYGITCLASNPNLYGYDTNSNAGFLVVQIITNDLINVALSDGSNINTNITGLDNFFPTANLGNGEGIPFYDSPGEVIFSTNLVQLSETEGFQTFLMFLPDETQQIPVPIEEVDWTWSGTASFTNGQWALISSNAVITINNHSTLTFPTWTNIAHNYNLQ